ncbi:MAG: OmpA family protein [Limnothrix sp.]
MSSSSPQPSAPSTTLRSSVTKRIIVFVLRIVVLAGFTAGAIALGLLAGHFLPKKNPQPPLFLRLLDSEAAKIVTPQPDLNETVATLSPEAEVAIEQEIAGIEAQLQVLASRTQKLESELNLDAQTGALDARLANLTELLAAEPEDFTPDDEAIATPDQANLKIALPSAALFTEAGQLKPEAEEILDAIAIDLQQTQSETITIAGHSFPEDKANAAALSLQQAQAVKIYLAQQVPGDLRWSVVGYGSTRPIEADNTQANQRIEITTTK